MPIKVFLNVTDGPSKGTAREFSTGKMIIGRGKVDLILFDKKVSTQHCKFEIEGEDCYLEDMNSTNGTFIRGKKVESRIKLQNLDEIIAGMSKISIAIVDQISDFKKKNTAPAKAPENAPDIEMIVESKEKAPAPSLKAPSTSNVKASVKASDLMPEPSDIQYRETGVRRIEDLIKDEMNTFSQWDHPNVVEDSGAIPRIKVHLTLKKGEGIANFTCSSAVSTIGRKNVDIKLSDLDCSRLHAQIEIVGGNKAFVKDLASTNGTFVNGKKISNHELKGGDLIQIGQTVFEIQIESAET